MEEYFFDRKLFGRDVFKQDKNDRIYFGIPVQRFDVRIPLMFGIVDAASSAIPAIIVRPVNVGYAYYSTEPGKQASNFLLSSSHHRLVILRALVAWVCLQALKILVSFAMYRRHSELLPLEQGMIVHRSQDGTGASSKYFFARDRLLRLMRLSIHMLLVSMAVSLVIALPFLACTRFLYNGDLLYDWLARVYLDFDTSASCFGSAWAASFWSLQLARSPFNPLPMFPSGFYSDLWSSFEHRPSVVPP